MNSSAPSFRIAALVGIALLPSSLFAAPPAPITEAQLAAIRADAATRAPVAEAKSTEAKAALDKNLTDSATASRAVASFLVQADLPPVQPDTPAAEPKPLEIPNDPNNTVITCDGGVYFDPDEAVLVYLKNVVVKDPRLDLSGANEVKVFFEKKTPAEKKSAKNGDKKPAKEAGADIGSNVGEVLRIVATGVLKIDQKPTGGKDPIQASGAILIYDIKADEAIIKGGYPWVRQGARIFSSKNSDNALRIYPNQSRFDTIGGGWNTSFPVPQKKPN